jgi:hypothetical protein
MFTALIARLKTVGPRRPWLAVVALAAALVPATAAHAEYFFASDGIQRVAKDYVSKHYANTYVSNLSTACRPQGEPYNPNYKYHRWVCGWYDRSDGTGGVVLIVGSSGAGAYYGKVLRGAHAM